MDLSKQIPGYLVEKGNIVRLILLTAGFALFFINLYTPFGSKAWIPEASDLKFFLYSNIIILTGVLVVVISRIIMYRLAKAGRRITLGNYLIWIVVEIVSMSLFYTIYEQFIIIDNRPFTEVFKASLFNTSLVLLLPYTTLWLYFSWRDKNKMLKQLAQEDIKPTETKQMIHFKDEKGTLRFSIKKEDLFYIKGTDNYVTIYYNNNQNKVENLMLRSTLRQMEEELKENHIVRCHRSFMVNTSRVKLIEKEKDGLILRLDHNEPLEVPVSKTYIQEIFNLFG